MSEATGAKRDFPAVSGGDPRRAGARLADAAFGDVAVEEYDLFEHIGGDWRNGEWGEQVGIVTYRQAPTTIPGRVVAHVTFVFDDGDVVEYVGLVPGEGTWQGKGRFGYRAGTGKFAWPRGELPVESVNPKSWG